MATTSIIGRQIRLASISRDRIDPAFEASLAAVEANVTSIYNTMSTDAERMAAIDALTQAFEGADSSLQSAITNLVNSVKTGAGLNADGSLTLGDTNYLGTSASLKAALLALDGALKIEETARIAGDEALRTDLQTLIDTGAGNGAAALAAAVAAQGLVDAAQDTALATETAARIAADTATGVALTNEQTARAAGDQALGDSIAAASAAATSANSAEATTRAAADTALQANIDAAALSTAAALAGLVAADSAESTARALADTKETAARIAGDDAMNTRLVVLEGGVASGITYDKMVNRETPVGVIDGVNAAFVLAFLPYAGSEDVFVNGLLQEPGVDGDYTIVGKDITLTYAPIVGDRVKVSYFR